MARTSKSQGRCLKLTDNFQNDTREHRVA
ncbi:rCG49582, isoform CRA_a [Rattus norvegicus]|uniref:RCG49582, isoform CRA_a n=1 Tax=Rattus norvegicus TaxID=10116 RepID=A6J2S4_RAT|nr:rCG49582, isoform CRA_a [Rattus norvegicus]